MATLIHTAHGTGELIQTRCERGRTSYQVQGPGFKVWVDATEVRVASEDGGEGPLFATPFTPDKFLDPASMERSAANTFSMAASPFYVRRASDAFRHEPDGPINESNSTTLPYDPSPQYPVDLFTDGTIQPGEYPIDPEQRLSPSDSRSQRGRRPSHPYPGPSPSLFAAATDLPDHSPWHSEGDRYEHMTSEEMSDPDYQEGVRHMHMRPWHRSSFDLDAGGAHRAPARPDQVDRVPHAALPELVTDFDDPDHLYMKWGPGGAKPRGQHAASMEGFLSAAEMGLSDKYADIQAAPERDPFKRDPLQFMSYRAAVVDDTMSTPRMGEYMDLVLGTKDPAEREAAWRDVRAKARQLRSEGRVAVNSSTPEAIYATVKGDTGTYDTMIVRGNVFDLGGQSVTAWHCECPWGQWAFKRRLTYVGRMCSHAYATYMQMQSNHDEVGTGGTRQDPNRRAAGIVEDFKSWAADYDQPIDYSSVNDFITQPRGDEDELPSRDDVSQLFEYVDGHPEMSPQREFDVPYTFDPDKVYKKAAEEDPRKPFHPRLLKIWDRPDFQQWLGANPDHPDPINGWMEENPKHYFDASTREADALRLTPHSLTPDLQFVPEGEPEHFVDVTKDDRKTTGPGQILHSSIREDYDPDCDEDADRGSEEIAHFSSLLAFGEADQHDVREPQARPDAGEATGDLNKLRDLIQEPLDESFRSMKDRNDDVRDLVDDLHDAGVDANNLVARRHMADTGIIDHYLDFAKGHWGGEISHSSLKDYVDKYRPGQGTLGDLLHLVDQHNHEASMRQADGDFLGQGGGDWADLPFAGSGPDPKDWFSTSEDYVNEHERPDFQDVTDLGDGDIVKYNDTEGPVTSPRQAAFLAAQRQHQSDVWSGTTDPGSVQTPNTAPLDGGEMSGGAPVMDAGDDMDMSMTSARYFAADEGALTDLLGEGKSAFGDMGLPGLGDLGSPSPSMPAGAGAADFVHSPFGSGGAGAADMLHPSGGAGAPGDMVSPSSSPDRTTFANQRARVSMQGRPSILDDINRRRAGGDRRLGYDTTTLPPGWGDVPSEDDDENPFPKIPGADQIDQLKQQMPQGMPKIPGMGGGAGDAGAAAEVAEIPPVVGGRRNRQDRWPGDASDIVRQFQATSGGQMFGRGGGSGADACSGTRAAAMAHAGGRPGRGGFSNNDIAGAADAFLTRTAGKTYSPAQQQELIDETPVGGYGARNLGGLDLSGTHYTAAYQ